MILVGSSSSSSSKQYPLAEPTQDSSPETQKMAFMMSSCHHHQPSSSSMATSPRFGARKPAPAPASLSFNTSAAHAHGCNLSFNTSHLSFSVSAAANNKVFEDQVRGIVCYIDDNGELICEGYDEGPRVGMRLPEKACFPWPVEVKVTDFIHLATLRTFEDDADFLQLKDDQERQL